MIMEDNPHSWYRNLHWNRHKAEQLLDRSEGDTTFRQLRWQGRPRGTIRVKLFLGMTNAFKIQMEPWYRLIQ
jgi:hypothetical protein